MGKTVFLNQEKSTVFRVVVYGPESTGKTTLCQDLAAHYKTHWVPEFARDYLQKKWNNSQQVCSLDDLPVIAKGQMDSENTIVKKTDKILFCDTNILVTQIWSETHFEGYCDPEIIAAANELHYDLYLLTGIDIPWEPDDLRDRPTDREFMFQCFENKLMEHKKPYLHIIGSRENRIKLATNAIDSIIL